MRDLNSWFPSDGSFSAWQDERNTVLNPELYEASRKERIVKLLRWRALGQKRDPSAAAILELKLCTVRSRYCYVKYLKRFHLNTTGTAITIKLASIYRQLKAFSEGSGKTPDITFSAKNSKKQQYCKKEGAFWIH